MIQQLIVTTENPEYNGTTLGVKFTDGKAVVTPQTPNRYKWPLEILAKKFQTELDGYEVQVIEEEAPPAPPPSGKKLRE